MGFKESTTGMALLLVLLSSLWSDERALTKEYLELEKAKLELERQKLEFEKSKLDFQKLQAEYYEEYEEYEVEYEEEVESYYWGLSLMQGSGEMTYEDLNRIEYFVDRYELISGDIYLGRGTKEKRNFEVGIGFRWIEKSGSNIQATLVNFDWVWHYLEHSLGQGMTGVFDVKVGLALGQWQEEGQKYYPGVAFRIGAGYRIHLNEHYECVVGMIFEELNADTIPTESEELRDTTLAHNMQWVGFNYRF